MGFASRLERRASPENPSTSLANPAAWLVDWMGGGKTKAGASVNEGNVLSLSAVWAAVRLLANAVAMTPIKTYRRIPRGKEAVTDHPAYRLLHERPNPEMTPFTFKQTTQAHSIIWGGGYAEIERDGADRPVALWPLLPHKTRAERRNGRKIYFTRVGNVDIGLAPDLVMHIPGLSYDGIMGYKLVQIARESLGLAKAVEEDAANFYGNGSRVSGVLQTDNKLSDKAYNNVRESWERMHTGLSNSHRAAILEEGLKWEQIGINPEEAQNLQSRKFSVSEVARWVGVPPHMIGDLERSTNNNIEEQGLEFLRYALGAWLVQWEQTVSHDLFAEDERSEMFAEFVRLALLSGDSVKRGQFYREMFHVGAISPNEIRERENMNPFDGGDIHVLPLNMGTPEQVENQPLGGQQFERGAVLLGPGGPKLLGTPEPRRLPAPAETPEISLAEYRERRSLDSRRRHQSAQRRVFEDAASRVVQSEANAVRRALRKNFGARDATGFLTWMDEYYETRSADWLRAFSPLFVTLAELIQGEVAEEMEVEAGVSPELQTFVDEYGETFAEAQSGKSRAQLRQIIQETEPEEVEAAIEQRLAEWEETRPAKIAFRETVQLGNAVARFSYGTAGVTRLVWRTRGQSCPLCNRLDGRTVGINESFANDGDVIEPEGEGAENTEPLRVKGSLNHPAAHRGCDCGIAPA